MKITSGILNKRRVIHFFEIHRHDEALNVYNPLCSVYGYYDYEVNLILNNPPLNDNEIMCSKCIENAYRMGILKLSTDFNIDGEKINE